MRSLLPLSLFVIVWWQFSFVLGMDAYVDLLNGKWAYSKELLEQTKFVVVDSESKAVYFEGIKNISYTFIRLLIKSHTL